MDWFTGVGRTGEVDILDKKTGWQIDKSVEWWAYAG